MTADVLSVVSDAIKILGPAMITALLAYLIAKAQMSHKLKELDNTHDFSARKYLFNHYKERGQQLHKRYKELNNSLSNLMGFTIGYTLTDKENEKEFMRRMAEVIRSYSTLTPMDLRITKKEMKKNECAEQSVSVLAGESPAWAKVNHQPNT